MVRALQEERPGHVLHGGKVISLLWVAGVIRGLLRSVLDWVFNRLGLVVLDMADYCEAAKQADELWHYVVHSGHIPNRFHAHSRIRSMSRRIAARLKRVEP